MILGPTVQTVERTNLAFCAGAVGASYVLAGPNFSLSVLAGAVVEMANLRVMWRHTEWVLGLGQPSKSGLAAMFGFGARFMLLALAIAAALAVGLHPIGLLIGLSLALPAVLISAWRHRPPVIEGLPALDAEDPEWQAWNPWTASERALPDEDDASKEEEI